jgi:large subunit ribosomal protein L3
MCITQLKTKSKDGYDSIQIGYGNVSSQRLTQPELGHLQKSNIQPLKYLKEFKVMKQMNLKLVKF